ncbi:MAG: AAA family ATPase [Candidatus Melainabacteria bacterium]|nr:AAA family ATPase [Candidatus Melainabacteria bacterium]
MSLSDFNFIPKDVIPKDLLPKDLRQKIQEHMGKDPSTLPIVTEQFERYNQPNLQKALNELTTAKGRESTILGIQGGVLNNFTGVALSDLVAPKSISHFVGLGGAKEGSVQYTNMVLDAGEKLPCMVSGLILVKGKPNLTILVRGLSALESVGLGSINLDVMAEDKNSAEEFIREISRFINKHNVYRGKLLSVDTRTNQFGTAGSTTLKFHTLPEISRDKIILPAELLNRIERQTVEVSQYSDKLKKAGRKMKRGILLHGKPGTGKTLTAMYLASAMKERTVLLVTGQGQQMIQSSCSFAKWLEPSMVIIEDVDLIAQERSSTGCNTPLLLELMNEMDGLADDCDVLFLLTTNRPEILEPALASRPGRIDQAYEVPLPDSDCRRRLFELYGKGLVLQVENLDKFIQRTQGASAAFISELLRKAALFAASSDKEEITITDKHLDEAIHEMLIAGGALTKSLLGSKEVGFTVKDSP